MREKGGGEGIRTCPLKCPAGHRGLAESLRQSREPVHLRIDRSGGVNPLLCPECRTLRLHRDLCGGMEDSSPGIGWSSKEWSHNKGEAGQTGDDAGAASGKHRRSGLALSDPSHGSQSYLRV